MKKILILFITLFIFGCKNSENMKNENEQKETVISIKEQNIEYADEIYLYDLIDIQNGKILTDNFLIDTSDLKNETIKLEYEDSNNKKQNYEFNLKIEDTTPPLILSSKSFSTLKGKDIDLNKKILCGDNYDRNLECLVEGNYDINKIGTYNLKWVAIDSSDNKTEKEFSLIVKEENKTSSKTEEFLIEDLIKNYKKENTLIGIDASSWQGDINWQLVKESGVEFAMLRIGYGHTKEGMILDKTFEQNLKGAKENNIPVGIYFYSYATTENEAKEQVKWIIETLNGEELELPIVFDWESWTEFNSYNINFVDLNNVAKVFMDETKKHGYNPMLYGSATYLANVWNLDEYPVWLAHYTKETNYKGDYDMWQITNVGKVPGINAYVDLDILYLK